MAAGLYLKIGLLLLAIGYAIAFVVQNTARSGSTSSSRRRGCT